MQGRREPLGQCPGPSAQRGSAGKVGMINAGVLYSTHRRNGIKHLSSSWIPSTNGYVRMYLARKQEYDHWKSIVASFVKDYETPEQMLDAYRLVLCSEPVTDGVQQVLRDVQIKMFRLEFLLFSFIHCYFRPTLVPLKESLESATFSSMRSFFPNLEKGMRRLCSKVRTIEATLHESIRGYDVVFDRDSENHVRRFQLLMPQWIDQRLAMIRNQRLKALRETEKISRREEEVKAREVEKEWPRKMKQELEIRLDGVTRNLKESRSEQEKVRFEEILRESKVDEERRFNEVEDQFKAPEKALQEEFERRLKAQDEEMEAILQRRLRITPTQLRKELIKDAEMKETALRGELAAKLSFLEEELRGKLEEEVNAVQSSLRMDLDRRFASLGNEIHEEFTAKSRKEEHELEEDCREALGSWEEHMWRSLMEEQAGREKQMYEELEQSVFLELQWRQEFPELSDAEIHESLSASIHRTFGEMRPDEENPPIVQFSLPEGQEGVEAEENMTHDSLRSLQNRLQQKKEAVARWERKVLSRRASMSAFLCPFCVAHPRDVLAIRCRHLVSCSRCFNEYLPQNCPYCKSLILKGLHCKLGN